MTSGQGDAVLLINGLSAPSVGWALQVKALSPRFQVVTFDNRGVGQTDLPPEPVYTTAQIADDAAAAAARAQDRAVPTSSAPPWAARSRWSWRCSIQSWCARSRWPARGPRRDARFLHTIESWISLAYRVPVEVEERYRHVVYPWLFTPEFFARKENVETAFQRAMAYPHQTKPEAIERQAKGIAAWNGTRVTRLADDPRADAGPGRQGRHPHASGVLQGAGPADSTRPARRAAGGHGFFLEHADLFNRALLRFLASVRAK